MASKFDPPLKTRGKFDLDLKPLDSRDCDLAEAVKDKVVVISNSYSVLNTLVIG